ncbi:hypothetical protein Cgig2_005177 [Carnegiea gigantea]|uniref:DDT domain-containing protein n=1 Tax=Carnegiea gigantea TaxID=171969 RepID=A0A9Q1KFE5_9CARY|nr:hypothetical protein Cgig2_005177 [Carnegiea gigantea]
MPLLKRKPFSLLEPPKDLQPRELVFQVRFTKEIFKDYQEYLKRISLYRQRLWTCKVTGKSNLTYEEALISEQRAAEKVQQFPGELIEPVLRIVQYSMLPLSDLVRKIRKDLQPSLVEGAELYGKKDGHVQACKLVKVLDEETGKTQYEVAWLDDAKMNDSVVVGEEDLIHKKLPFGREVLKSYIRKSTYRSLPWVVHHNLASKYGIPTDPPEELKSKMSFLNGYIVTNKKRKKNAEGNLGNNKRSRQESDGVANGAGNGDESIKYPIDDLLVQPGDDDPVFTDRPPPSREFSTPMDCVGDLLMVWDFCSSFGRMLYLWPFSFEDFEKAMCHKDSNLALIVETHAALFRLLIKDEGEYYRVFQQRKRKPKITLITWTEYLCDFIEMTSISDLTTHIPTIKRGHYGLLDTPIKLKILKELVDRAIATDVVREKLDEYLEERHALAAAKRGEALEEGKKKREAKERLRAVSETNGVVLEPNSDTVEDLCNGQSLENGSIVEKMSSDQNHSLSNGDSDHPGGGLHEKTKKLLEELERSKEQRVCVTPRLFSIIKNFLKRKWRSESFARILWAKTEIIIDIGFSDVMDGYLLRILTPINGAIIVAKKSKELQKRSKDIDQKIGIEDSVVRRSTRVRAPPKDNPALAFLKYSNKWKVLMG